MKYFLLIISLTIIFHKVGFSQSGFKALSIDVSLSPEAGRWIYNRGLNDQGDFRGFDRSFLSYLVSYEIGLVYHHNRIRTGVHFSYRLLIEDQLIRSQHSRFNFHRYQVTEAKAVKLPTLFFDFGLDLVRFPKFNLIPQVSFGTFFLNTVHPEKENFGLNFVWSAGFISEFEKGRFSLFVHPHYTSYVIFPKENLFPGELNQIYSMGLKFGARCWLVKKE